MEKRLITADELAVHLGIERSTVLRLVRERRIPAFALHEQDHPLSTRRGTRGDGAQKEAEVSVN